MYFDYPHEAAEDFRDELKTALDCVIEQVHLKVPTAFYATPDGVHALALNGGLPVRLAIEYREGDGEPFDEGAEPPLSLVFAMHFRIESNDDRFRASVVQYIMQLVMTQRGEQLQALMEWHWHPESTTARTIEYPHLHIRNALGPLIHSFNKRHVATSRVTLEDVIEFLITDVHVKPRVPDWKVRLDANRDVYRDRRQRY